MITTSLTSIYRGGRTAEFVKAEIAKRFGVKVAEQYDPTRNCFTFLGWKQRGFKVKKGEKAIKSITFIEIKDSAGNMVSYPKSVFLFARPQVEPGLQEVVDAVR